MRLVECSMLQSWSDGEHINQEPSVKVIAAQKTALGIQGIHQMINDATKKSLEAIKGKSEQWSLLSWWIRLGLFLIIRYPNLCTPRAVLNTQQIHFQNQVFLINLKILKKRFSREYIRMLSSFELEDSYRFLRCLNATKDEKTKLIPWKKWDVMSMCFESDMIPDMTQQNYTGRHTHCEPLYYVPANQHKATNITITS